MFGFQTSGRFSWKGYREALKNALEVQLLHQSISNFYSQLTQHDPPSPVSFLSGVGLEGLVDSYTQTTQPTPHTPSISHSPNTLPNFVGQAVGLSVSGLPDVFLTDPATVCQSGLSDGLT